MTMRIHSESKNRCPKGALIFFVYKFIILVYSNNQILIVLLRLND